MDGPVENYEDQEENYEEQENYEGQEGENGDSHNYEEEEGEEEDEEEEDPNNTQIEQEETEQDNNGENITNNDNNNNNNNLYVASEEMKFKGWPGENAFRILVPGHKVGAVIGHKGDIIKKMAEETKARIRILNSPPGAQERVVLITAKEEPDLQVSPAMEGLFRVHKRIVDGLEPDSEPPVTGSVPATRLLVPGVQAAMVIGKQGATIKLIQEGSGAVVRVSENVPPLALYDDRIVEIQGEPTNMHKALELISTYLRKFLIDRSIIPLFEAQNQQNLQQQHQQQPPAQQQWGPPPSQNYGAPPPYSAPAGPGYNNYMPPQAHDNYYPPPDMPPRYEKPPPYAAPAAAGATQAAPHVISQVTQHMQVPLSYVDAVIGADGANISYIRRASGATVTVQETRGVPGEMTVEMVGSAAQVQTAQQLIQNFMAEAAPPGVVAPAAAGTAAPSGGPETGYGAYSGYGSAYGSAPPGAAPADPAGPPYGSSYPAGYGY